MPIPLTVAAPAAIAAGAYLSARWQIGHDLNLVKAVVLHNWNSKRREKADRFNIFYLLEERAQNKQDADRVLLWYEGQSWTFKQVYDIVLKYAAWMKHEHGVTSKDIVALDCTNSPKFLFITLALWSLGARPAMINYNLGEEPLLHCIKVSTANLIFVDDEVEDKFTPEVRNTLSRHDFVEGGGSVRVVVVSPSTETHIASCTGFRESHAARAGAGNITGDTLAALMYTSGTTGKPKAAKVAWRKFYASGAFAMGWMGMTRNDVYYTCMPLYHGTAAVTAAIPAVIQGFTIAIGHKFSNKTFWPEVRASGATVIQYVGETCRYLLAAPPQIDPLTGANLDKSHKVRLAFGNGLRPDVWDKFKERFGIPTIAEFYSASEGAGAFWNISSNNYSSGAIGRSGSLIPFLFRGTHEIVKVDFVTEEPARDPANNNFCTRVAINQPGELLYKLDPADIQAAYDGYFKNEKASNDKILRDVFVKGDAYFRSGDTIRKDSEGRVYFMDRIGDTYRWRSENVSTSEVADVFGNHPAIEEANVYGVPVPHHEGNAGCAAITLHGRQEPTESLLSDLAAHAQKSLPKYAVPVFLRLSKEMATTGNNKQQKHGLRIQGADPSKIDNGDRLFWLQDGSYREFGAKEWERLNANQVKL